MAVVGALSGGGDAGTASGATTPALLPSGGGTLTPLIGDVPVCFSCDNSGSQTITSSAPTQVLDAGPVYVSTTLGGYQTCESGGLTSGDISGDSLSFTWSGAARNLSAGVLLRSVTATGRVIGTPNSATTAATINLPTITAPNGSTVVVGVIARCAQTTPPTISSANLTAAGYTIGRAVATANAASPNFAITTATISNFAGGSIGGTSIAIGNTPTGSETFIIAFPAVAGPPLPNAQPGRTWLRRFAHHQTPTHDTPSAGPATFNGAASLDASGAQSLLAGGTLTEQAAAAIIAAASLAAAGVVTENAAAAITASASVAAAAVVTENGAANLLAIASLIASATQTFQAAAAITASASLAATPTLTQQAAAAINASASLQAAAVVTENGAAAILATASVVAGGTVTPAGAAASLTAPASLAAAGTLTQQAAAAIAATASVVAAAVVTKNGAAAITAPASLAAAAVVTKNGAAAISSAASVTAGAVVTRFGAVSIAALAQLNATAGLTQLAAVGITQSSSLSASGTTSAGVVGLPPAARTATATGPARVVQASGNTLVTAAPGTRLVSATSTPRVILAPPNPGTTEAQ